MRIILLALALSVTPALAIDAFGVPGARLYCTPVDGSARILASADPDDAHPSWAGGSFVGASWTFVSDGRRIRGQEGPFLRGNLVSPRGNVTDQGVFVVESDWNCGPAKR